MMNWYKKWISKRSLQRSIRRANKNAMETGRRYYVVRVSGGKLAVVDNSFMKIYNRNAKVKIKAVDLAKMTLYCTPWTTKRR